METDENRMVKTSEEPPLDVEILFGIPFARMFERDGRDSLPSLLEEKHRDSDYIPLTC